MQGSNNVLHIHFAVNWFYVRQPGRFLRKRKKTHKTTYYDDINFDGESNLDWKRPTEHNTAAVVKLFAHVKPCS